MTDALTLLREDHRRVRELFREFERAEDGPARRAIADNAVFELRVHSALEEEFFYPAVQKEAGIKDRIDEAREEHHAADLLMNELAEARLAGQDFEAKFKVLAETIQRHILEEESQVLPRAAEAGIEWLEKLGERMVKRRRELMTELREVRVAQRRDGARARAPAGPPTLRPRGAAKKSRSTRTRTSQAHSVGAGRSPGRRQPARSS